MTEWGFSDILLSLLGNPRQEGENMAFEVRSWKQPDSSLTLSVDSLTTRKLFSEEINEEYGEGGGLNANYRTVEAVAIAANVLGIRGMRYGGHFVFKTGGGGEISFDFFNPAMRDMAQKILARFIFERSRASTSKT